VLLLRLKDGVLEGRDEEIRRLLYEIKAKGGLPPSRINRFLKQLDAGV
jgi:hypothetical protein